MSFVISQSITSSKSYCESLVRTTPRACVCVCLCMSVCLCTYMSVCLCDCRCKLHFCHWQNAVCVCLSTYVCECMCVSVCVCTCVCTSASRHQSVCLRGFVYSPFVSIHDECVTRYRPGVERRLQAWRWLELLKVYHFWDAFVFTGTASIMLLSPHVLERCDNNYDSYIIIIVWLKCMLYDVAWWYRPL